MTRASAATHLVGVAKAHRLNNGARIALARVQRNFESQGQLARAAGVDQSTIAKIESGERHASGEMLEHLLSVLKMTVIEFYQLEV